MARNKSVPFKVESKGQLVEVLGTHFNIKAYDDESLIRTTLLEGSVKIHSGQNQAVLKPGEQSQIGNQASLSSINIRKVNLEEVIAWKNGIFEFDNASIEDVMRSTARWYDINVSYSGKVPDIRISGKISRKVNFSGLVQLWEFEGVKFRIKEKNVVITN